MLQRARARCPGLEFVAGDAQQLPFEAASFDAVTMNFGTLHLADPDAALAEAHRVVRPGGRYALTAWAPDGNAQAEIVGAALAEHAVPVEVPEGPAYFRFADAAESRRALSEAGFDADSVRIETVEVLWRLPAADFLFEAERHAGVRTAAVLAAQPPGRLESIRMAMAEGVRRYADGREYALPIVARVVSARAPLTP